MADDDWGANDPIASSAQPNDDWGANDPVKEGLGIMSLPSDVAEFGARGINWAAQNLTPQSLRPEPRQPQPLSFERADPRNPNYSGIWKKAAESAISGATAPGEAYAGKLDPLSDEGIRRATELGMFVSPMSPAAGTGAAVAREAVPRGSFATRNVAPPIAAEARATQEAAQEFGVPLSRGFAAKDPEAMRMEDIASRSTVYGKAAQDAARGHFEEQAGALGQASKGIGETVAREGPIIEHPREAGEILGTGIRGKAQQARDETGRLYKETFDLPGQFHAGAFEGIGNRIKGNLTLRDEPVIIDDVTAPIATKALGELDRISGLKFQNLADPRGMPNAENIVAVNLRGVDQARKRLNAYYAATRRGQNNNDVRAVGAIIHEFDDQVENAIANGLFSGDERALGALRAARASYSNYVKTFRPQGSGDDVGMAMRKIIDRNATPEEISNMVVGIGKIGEKGTPVRLAERLEKVFGKDSDELSAVRQAIWQKSQIRNTDGNLSVARSAEATDRLANSTLGRQMYSPEEREVMRKYANVLRSTIITKYARTNSDTTPAILQMLKQHRGTMLSLVGHGKGIPFLGHMMDYLSNKVQEGAMTRKVQESLSPFPPAAPLGGTAMSKTPRPVISPLVVYPGNRQSFQKGGRVTKSFRYADGGSVPSPMGSPEQQFGDVVPPSPPSMAGQTLDFGPPMDPNNTNAGDIVGQPHGQVQLGSDFHSLGVPSERSPDAASFDYAYNNPNAWGITRGDLQSPLAYTSPDWKQPEGGGWYTLGQLGRRGLAPNIGTEFQSGVDAPSTNNWRLLGTGPGFIMRNGQLINVAQANSRGGTGLHTNEGYGAPWRVGSGATRGVPSYWSTGWADALGYGGWPGGPTTVGGVGGSMTARGGRINKRADGGPVDPMGGGSAASFASPAPPSQAMAGQVLDFGNSGVSVGGGGGSVASPFGGGDQGIGGPDQYPSRPPGVDPSMWAGPGGTYNEAAYLAKTAADKAAPQPSNYPYLMNADTLAASRQAGAQFGIDPFALDYGADTASGFKLNGSDPFPSLNKGNYDYLNRVPTAMRPLLAPALVRHYEGIFGGGSKNGRGIAALNAPWTRAFAPPGPEYPLGEAMWEASYFRDPWFRLSGQPSHDAAD